MSSTKFEVAKHIFLGQHIRHYAGATRNSDDAAQYLEAKQYTPRSSKNSTDGITIISTCAISFPKEMYEPLFDELLQCCEQQGLRIRSIWSVDKSDHGASGILNERTQGDDPSHSDFARDLLNMVNLFRDQMSQPIVGIGHSMGATALLELAHIHPRLFSSLVLTDPIIGPTLTAGAILGNASSHRPDLWQSREEAEKAFTSAKTMKKWDPRVLQLWLDYGLRDTPTLVHPEPGKVTLRTPKANEAWSYLRSWFDTKPTDEIWRTTRSLAKYPDLRGEYTASHPFYQAAGFESWDFLTLHSMFCVISLSRDRSNERSKGNGKESGSDWWWSWW